MLVTKGGLAYRNIIWLEEIVLANLYVENLTT
jgi:hypothetical protein